MDSRLAKFRAFMQMRRKAKPLTQPPDRPPRNPAEKEMFGMGYRPVGVEPRMMAPNLAEYWREVLCEGKKQDGKEADDARRDRAKRLYRERYRKHVLQKAKHMRDFAKGKRNDPYVARPKFKFNSQLVKIENNRRAKRRDEEDGYPRINLRRGYNFMIEGNPSEANRLQDGTKPDDENQPTSDNELIANGTDNEVELYGGRLLDDDLKDDDDEGDEGDDAGPGPSIPPSPGADPGPPGAPGDDPRHVDPDIIIPLPNWSESTDAIERFADPDAVRTAGPIYGAGWNRMITYGYALIDDEETIPTEIPEEDVIPWYLAQGIVFDILPEYDRNGPLQNATFLDLSENSPLFAYPTSLVERMLFDWIPTIIEALTASENDRCFIDRHGKVGFDDTPGARLFWYRGYRVQANYLVKQLVDADAEPDFLNDDIPPAPDDLPAAVPDGADDGNVAPPAPPKPPPQPPGPRGPPVQLRKRKRVYRDTIRWDRDDPSVPRSRKVLVHRVRDPSSYQQEGNKAILLDRKNLKKKNLLAKAAKALKKQQKEQALKNRPKPPPPPPPVPPGAPPPPKPPQPPKLFAPVALTETEVKERAIKARSIAKELAVKEARDGFYTNNIADVAGPSTESASAVVYADRKAKEPPPRVTKDGQDRLSKYGGPLNRKFYLLKIHGDQQYFNFIRGILYDITNSPGHIDISPTSILWQYPRDVVDDAFTHYQGMRRWALDQDLESIWLNRYGTMTHIPLERYRQLFDTLRPQKALNDPKYNPQKIRVGKVPARNQEARAFKSQAKVLSAHFAAIDEAKKRAARLARPPKPKKPSKKRITALPAAAAPAPAPGGGPDPKKSAPNLMSLLDRPSAAAADEEPEEDTTIRTVTDFVPKGLRLSDLRPKKPSKKRPSKKKSKKVAPPPPPPPPPPAKKAKKAAAPPPPPPPPPPPSRLPRAVKKTTKYGKGTVTNPTKTNYSTACARF
jgi:hypothetical protein